MKIDFKWLKVPRSNETRYVQVVQMWEVRWWSRRGASYSEDNPSYATAKPELECFRSEDDALAFKESIENAFALLRYSGTGITVKVSKAL